MKNTVRRGMWPRFTSLVVATAALVWSAPALAQNADQPAPEEPPGESTGMYLHDGFYLRVAVGGGRLRDDFEHEVTRLIGLGAEGHAEGASVGGELSAGYALKPGLILGGGVFVEQVASPKVEIGDQDVSDDVSVGTLVLAGPIIEWYFQPDGGFHLGGGPMGARLQIKDETGGISDHEPVGGGIVAGFGYDWWVGEQWALGVMGRFVAARLEDDDIVHTVTVGSLMLTATYN